MKTLIREELAKLDAQGNRTPNTETLAYIKAMNHIMRLENGDDVIEMFGHSYRIFEDLSASLRYPPHLFDVKLVLRQWREEVPSYPEGEFRAFVHNKNLNALTQYFTCICFPQLVADKDIIVKRVKDFFAAVRDKIQMDHYVIDFLVLKDEVLIVELNPFYKSAGAGLFSWRDDRKMFLEGPFECRLTTHDLPNAKEFIHLNWLRFIDVECVPPSKDARPFVAIAILGLVCAAGIYLYQSKRSKQ